MARGIITRSGRILTARLLFGETLEGITHCAIGDGDATFLNPQFPPDASMEQTALLHERARKRSHGKSYLTEDPEGSLFVNGLRYRETAEPTQIIAFFFRFEEHEANGIIIREYGFFGGGVSYVEGHVGEYAPNGVYHALENPSGTVQSPGVLYEVKNIPDFHKIDDTRLELVAIIKI